MAIKLKSGDTIAKKFATRGAAAAGDYKSGVESTRRERASSAAASKDTYAAGGQAAIGRNACEKGGQEAGDAKWKRKGSDVGSECFPQWCAPLGRFRGLQC